MTIIYSQSSLIITVSVLILFSIGLRLVFEALGQRWITTYAHTATLTLLPLITFVITKVISGNIALSLGMVGALSIVRFRNPVRSPLELSVYFLAITMGIAASVNLKWLLFLVFVIVFALLSLSLLSLLSKFFLKKAFFNASFSEGNTLSTLEITTPYEVEILSKSMFLKSESSSGKSVDYLLVSGEIKNLRALLSDVKLIEDAINYRINVG